MSNAIRLDIVENYATLIFDQPNSKANVLSTPFWQELGAQLDTLKTRTDLGGLLLRSAKPDIFIAGADLKELANAEVTNPAPTRAYVELGLRVLTQLEQLPFATVAVIDGAAVGGGWEVALACDFRIRGTNPKAVIGFPEINLGLLPGWGGTQRMARLTGVEETITRILSGELYDTAEQSPPSDLLETTCESTALQETALELCGWNWQEIREVKLAPVATDLLPSAGFPDEVHELLNTLEERKRPAGFEIVKVVLQGSLLPFVEAMPLETDAFVRLAGTPASRELIAEFFASRRK